MREYLSMKGRTTEPKAVSETTFMRIIAMVTSGQQGIKNNGDYCLGVPVFGNIRNLEYIVGKSVTNVILRKKLLLELGAVGDFSKHGYESHLDEDEDPAHNCTVGIVGSICSTVCRSVQAGNEAGNENQAKSMCHFRSY